MQNLKLCCKYNSQLLCFFCVCVLQITVYLGKRDFVDHITHVDPIGKGNVKVSITEMLSCSLYLCHSNF
jgi:hypothetical protein